MYFCGYFLFFVTDFRLINSELVDHSLSVNHAFMMLDQWVTWFIHVYSYWVDGVMTESTVPFAFADNWSWVTRTVRDLFRNWVKVLNLVAALRMKVDPSKSWVWATSPQMRKDLQSLWLLFPGEDIQVEMAVGAFGQFCSTSYRTVFRPSAPWWTHHGGCTAET